MTFVSAESFLGHFGLGGVGDSSARVTKFFDRLGIEGLPNTVIKEVAPPHSTAVPADVPKTGQMSETMAKVAAHNIVADLQGGKRRAPPINELAAIYILDAGNNGVIFKADKVLGADGTAHVMSGPQAHWAKLAFERYSLASRKRGLVAL